MAAACVQPSGSECERKGRDLAQDWRYGMVALRSGGYILPAGPQNQERMEWLATAIRAAKGEASVVQAYSFDDLPAGRLKQMFIDARTHDYRKLLQEVKRHT